MGAFAAARSLFSAVVPSCDMPALSTFSSCQTITEWGGSDAASANIFSKEMSLHQVNETRLSNGFHCLVISCRQYCSDGELPLTSATIRVSGSTCSMFSMNVTRLPLTATMASLADSKEGS